MIPMQERILWSWSLGLAQSPFHLCFEEGDNQVPGADNLPGNDTIMKVVYFGELSILCAFVQKAIALLC